MRMCNYWLKLFLVFLIYTSVFGDIPQERPNIVFILGDDQHWSDYGFMGSKDVHTPYLDNLAGQSLTFKRGYVAAPICRPSLASMVTGLFPHQHGITGNYAHKYEDRANRDIPFRKAFHNNPFFY